MEDLLEEVRRAVENGGLPAKGQTAVCALSGGADSVSLLLALKEISGEYGFKLGACHFNHGLRGEESDSDERFCEELCKRLEVPLFKGKADVGRLQKKHESLEEAARRARYAFFDEALAFFGENSVIATAHNADDNAETVLLNLIRGTGLRGLCGIPRVRERIIRPLLGVSRSGVEDFLAKKRQDFVTDSTNLSDEYTRNKIRQRIIPEILKINPSLSQTVGRMCETLREDEEYLDSLARDALGRLREGGGWNALGLSQLPGPIKARAVKKILQSGGVEPSKLRVDTAISLLENRRARYNPCKDHFFTIRRGVCFVEVIEQKFGGFNEKKA